ncbi:hypothetical protein [Bradyrhizobium sp. CCBAU 51627]|nr:hypothetical protein [Bradyrhizobium sp. CCBAU 51627]
MSRTPRKVVAQGLARVQDHRRAFAAIIAIGIWMPAIDDSDVYVRT